MEFSWPEITSGTKQSLSVAVFRQAAFWSGGGTSLSFIFHSVVLNILFLLLCNFIFSYHFPPFSSSAHYSLYFSRPLSNYLSHLSLSISLPVSFFLFLALSSSPFLSLSPCLSLSLSPSLSLSVSVSRSVSLSVSVSLCLSLSLSLSLSHSNPSQILILSQVRYMLWRSQPSFWLCLV